jgi:hypothetical protein
VMGPKADGGTESDRTRAGTEPIPAVPDTPQSTLPPHQETRIAQRPNAPSTDRELQVPLATPYPMRSETSRHRAPYQRWLFPAVVGAAALLVLVIYLVAFRSDPQANPMVPEPPPRPNPPPIAHVEEPPKPPPEPPVVKVEPPAPKPPPPEVKVEPVRPPPVKPPPVVKAPRPPPSKPPPPVNVSHSKSDVIERIGAMKQRAKQLSNATTQRMANASLDVIRGEVEHGSSPEEAWKTLDHDVEPLLR